jgi:His-Xaa-Ser system protein HxsD
MKTMKQDDDWTLVEVDTGLYHLEAVMQTASRFTDQWFVRVDQGNEGVIKVLLKPKDDQTVGSDTAADLFLNELIDEQARVLIAKDCGTIRDLIVKKAFSPIE